MLAERARSLQADLSAALLEVERLNHEAQHLRDQERVRVFNVIPYMSQRGHKTQHKQLRSLVFFLATFATHHFCTHNACNIVRAKSQCKSLLTCLVNFIIIVFFFF